MTDQPGQVPIQNPLTLVMTAKSPDDYVALRQVVQNIQALPAAQNPVVVALNSLANVHFARFSFLDDNRQIAVITTYDNGFEDYINEFVDKLGDVFDALLAHVQDSPPLPVQAHRQEFLDFVRAHDLRCVGSFYSAYPTRTVLDIAGTGPVGQ
jgi:hypothetical protein